MRISDHEKLLQGMILNNLNDAPFLSSIFSELDYDKFGDTDLANTYKRLSNRFIKGETLSLIDLHDSTGIPVEFFETLKKYPGKMGIENNSGYEVSMRVIHTAGRLRHIKNVVSTYDKMFETFEETVLKVKDVEGFITDFTQLINEKMGNIKTEYKPFSVAIDNALRHVDKLKEGYVVDIIPCGIPSLERFFIPRPSSMGVIIGISSMGKTQLALLIAQGVAKNLYENNLPGIVAINSLETPGERLAFRLASSLSNIDTRKLEAGELDDKDFNKFTDTLESLSDYPIEYDDNPSMTTDKLQWQATVQHAKHGRKLGIHDYAELFSDKADSEELRVSQIVRNLRKISFNTASCETLLSQVNNSVMGTSSKIAGLHRARYSGSLEHSIEWGLEIYNPPQMRKRNIPYTLPDGFEHDMAYVLVEKNKEYEVGQFPMIWEAQYKVFRDPAFTLNGNLYTEKEIEFDEWEDEF